MKMFQCSMDNGNDTNIRALTDIVLDDELEVGDVDQAQTPRMLLKSLLIQCADANSLVCDIYPGFSLVELLHYCPLIGLRAS